jgi:hypothetical protein
MLTVGTFSGQPTKLVITEKESGAVMVEIPCRILNEGFERDTITARQCLISKDGSISDVALRMMREVFGANSLDEIVALQSRESFDDIFVELVIDEEEYDNKRRLTVKYLNPPGGGLSKPVDAEAFKRKWGPKFRAVLGGAPVAPRAVAPKAQAPASAPAPGAPTAPARKAPPMPKKKIVDSSMDECWELFVAANPELSDDKLTEAWVALVAKVFPDRDNLTASEWGRVKADIKEESIPY